MPTEPRRLAVLDKVDTLLSLLARDGELGAGRLAELTGEPRSSVYRLLASLQRLGLVEPAGARGSYRLGIKLFRLGSAVMARLDERTAALPAMKRLSAETAQTVLLCVRRRGEAICVERIGGRWVEWVALDIGMSVPLHASVAGRVLLAFEPPETWPAALEQARAASAVHAPPAESEVTAELAAVRAGGYARAVDDMTRGLAALAFPVFDHQERIRAALVATGPDTTLNDAVVVATQAAAAAVSAALGSREPMLHSDQAQ